MSKHFAMLNATRRLENYLSRENYNLNRMSENDRIPISLFEKKVEHYNELVTALNELFASLTDSPSSELFARYALDGEEAEVPVFTIIPGQEPAEEYEGSAPAEQVPFYPQAAAVTETTEINEGNETEETEKSEDPAWITEGYESVDVWLADKEAECVQFSGDDLSLSVNDAMSRYRAEQALDEYSETSVRDIASYLPEDDSPVNVLPSDDDNEEQASEVVEDDKYDGVVDSEDEYEEETEVPLNENEDVPVTDYAYLDHTVDNVRVDNDPTQIAGVETAVERYGENARQGTDIDVSSFLYRSEPSVVDSLISEDIKQLHAFELSDESKTDSTENID